MAGYLPGSYKLSRSRATAEAYMELNSGLKSLLDSQAQYLKAAQTHTAGLTMQQAPDIGHELKMKRKGPGII